MILFSYARQENLFENISYNFCFLLFNQVYTTAGMEVARVTVVNSECEVIYETLVKPDHEILDYNTR